MKKIIGFLAALVMLFTLSSCVTTAQAHVDDVYDDVDINLVVTYGVPYYDVDGLLMYYIYRNMYYYPYFYYNRYYLHRYYRPLPPSRMHRYRPVPRDAFKNHYHPNMRHHGHMPKHNTMPSMNHRRPIGDKPNPNIRQIQPSRPNTSINRGPSIPNINSSRGSRSMSQPRGGSRPMSGGRGSGRR